MFMAALAAVAIASSASAQAQAAPAQAQPQGQAQRQLVTISGKLELIDGMIGLKSGGTAYYTPRLRILVGFVKDLQEDATVNLTGYAYPLPNRAGYAVFFVTKVSFGGKDYDLGQRGGPFGGRGWGEGRGGMMGGGGW
jgi:hypothetical protein